MLKLVVSNPHKDLEIPCSYQGGKQRVAKDIVDRIFKDVKVNSKTLFFDLCCGCGAVSLELINRGIHPNNLIMIDNSCWGAFWKSIANDEFDLKAFEMELSFLPNTSKIQEYLKTLSNEPVMDELMVYHYLMLQSGSFGGKQIYIENSRWKNNSFRSYWKPTETSNRRSPVNPMMPMPNTLFDRVSRIVNEMGGCVTALQEDVFRCINLIRTKSIANRGNAIIYIDPPYAGTTGYQSTVDIYKFLEQLKGSDCPIYVSEGHMMSNSTSTFLLSKGRAKGNISGNIKRKPTEEWLNVFRKV